VVATVNGQEITWDDLEFEVLARQAAMGLRYEGIAGEEPLAELRQATLERLIDRLLLVEEAQRRGHKADPAGIKAEEEKFLSRLPRGTELARRVVAGRYRSQIAATARRTATGAGLIEDLQGQIQVSAAQVEEFYRQNPGRFRRPETVMADEILLSDQAKARAARQRLLEGGSPDGVAREFETESRRMALIQGVTDPARTSAVWKLSPGEISGVVRIGELGYAVLKVVERQPAQTIPFEQVRPSIERALRNQEDRRLLGDLLKRLRAEAKIQKHWVPAVPQAPRATPAPALSPTPAPSPP
jgi:parvulin-like peptidyl-prolyl isomerase